MLTGGAGGGGGGRSGPIVRAGRGNQNGQQLQNMMQPFSGGVSKSERILCAGTDGSVAEVEANIEQAVRQFGAAPGAKKMMDGERIAAEEAMQTGLYGVWRNVTSGTDFCGRIGAVARCFCGHDYSAHTWSKGRRELKPSCSKCPCRGFSYIPKRPEEVGEYWLPRRRGFDVNIWRAKCKCGHSHEDHDPNNFGCRCCGCADFHSAWLCTGCDGKWEDHETLWETEEERRLQRRPVGQAFMPLASTPAIQQMVLDDSARGEGARSHALPHRPRPERSVKLMRERCDNYGGRNATRAALQNDPFQGSSLEDAFPPQSGRPQSGRRAATPGSLEDAFPPRQGGFAGYSDFGALEDMIPPQQRDAGGLEDAFPPRSGGGGGGVGGRNATGARRTPPRATGGQGGRRTPPRATGGQANVGTGGRPLIRRGGTRSNPPSGASTPTGSRG